MTRHRLASKSLLAAVVSLAVLAALGAWLAFRPPAALRTLVRGTKAGAGPETGAAEARPGDAPAASTPGPAAIGDPPAGAAGGDSPSAPGDVAPEAAHVLRGVVVTPGGAPIAGARVGAARSPEPEAEAAGPLRREEDVLSLLAAGAASGVSITDARGRFEIFGLAAGHYDLEVAAPGFGRRKIARARSREATSESEEGALRIVLHPELFLEGEVLDRRGRPIDGAEVTLTFLAADAGDLAASGGGEGSGPPAAGPVLRARTEAGGRFRLGGLGRGVYRVEAAGAGYAPAIAPLVEIHDPAREQSLVFELDESRRVRGVVRTEGGGPLAGARVRLLGPGRRGPAAAGSGREVRTAATGADGAFEIEGLPENGYALHVSASGHRNRFFGVVADDEPAEIALEPQVPLEGTIVDRRSGSPVPDAELRWEVVAGAWIDAEPAPAARTDAGGRFRIERFPEDGRAIRIDAEGYSALEVDAADAPEGGGWMLALERSGSVSGRVRAAPGLPVEGLRVSLIDAPVPGAAGAPLSGESRPSRPLSLISTTDPEGFYRVSVPGTGSYRVVVDGDPYVVATSEVVIVPDERTEIDGVDIFLSLAATVEGFVFSRDLGRVAGALVRVVPEGPREDAQTSGESQHLAAAERASLLRGHREARADATGAFTVSGLRAGAYRAIARAPGFITARSESFHLADGGTQVIELELEPEMTITGRVLEPAGAPIPLAEIRAVPGGEAGEPWNREMSLSSAAGTFRLSRLAPRSYDLRFSAEGFAPDVLFGVAAGSEDASVRLERLVPLSGRVLGTYTGEPVVQFKLRLRFVEEHRLSARDGESLHGWRSFSDAAGAFRIDDVPPGLYLVEASAPGHMGVEAVEIEVPPGGLEDAEILLEEAGLVMGVVVDGHGNGIPGARVEALQRQVDPDRGTVSFRPISLPSPRSGRGADGASGDGGGERRRRGGRGSRDGQGGDRSPAAVRTGDDGSFAIRGLPDGVYRLSVTHDDHLSRELGDYAFENGLSGHAPVTLSILLPSGVTLLGRVRGVPGAGAGEISILLRPVSLDADSRGRRARRTKSARVDASGRFEIRGLEVGEYVLTARYRGADGSPVSMRRDLRIHGAGREQGVLLDFSR